MNPLAAIWSHYVCWRHSKGYGVHSPFAFRLVNDVISPGEYAFYGYSKIDNACRLKRVNHFRYRFILRLVIFLKSRRLLFTSGLQQAYRAIGDATCIPVLRVKDIENFNFLPYDTLVCEGEISLPSSIHRALEKGVNVIAFNPNSNLRDLLEKPMETGLLLSGKNLICLFPKHDMAYTAYPMLFKNV